MSTIQNRNFHIALCLLLTTAAVASAAAMLYLVLSFFGAEVWGYFCILLLAALCILLSDISIQAKLILTLTCFALPYFGVVFNFYLWLGKSGCKMKNNEKVRLWVDKHGKTDGKTEKVAYFADAEEMFYDLLKEVGCAKSEVLISSYILSLGKASAMLFTALFEALRRGVKVVLSVDYFGSGDIRRSDEVKALMRAGAVIRVNNKPLLLLFGKDNRRTHAKIWLVDRIAAYFTSANIADESIFTDKNSGIKTVGDLNYIFNEFAGLFGLYAAKNNTENSISALYPVCANGNGYVESIFTSVIFSAEKSITIITPYLSVDKTMLSAISAALNRGVKITVIIPEYKADKKTDKITCDFGDMLSRGGVEVYRYREGFLHQKLILRDNNFILSGSANFDIRSGRYATESVILTDDKRLIAPLLKDISNIMLRSERYAAPTKKPSDIRRKVMWLIAPLI